MQTIMSIFKDFGGTGYYSILFVLALIYLAFSEEDKRVRTLFVYIPAVMLLLFFLPPFYMLYNRLDEGTYYRILWLMPMTVIIAYAGCKAIGRHVKTGVLLGSLVLIMSGSYVYNSIYMSPAENMYHIPQETIEICDMIKPAEGEERVWALFPADPPEPTGPEPVNWEWISAKRISIPNLPHLRRSSRNTISNLKSASLSEMI